MSKKIERKTIKEYADYEINEPISFSQYVVKVNESIPAEYKGIAKVDDYGTVFWERPETDEELEARLTFERSSNNARLSKCTGEILNLITNCDSITELNKIFYSVKNIQGHLESKHLKLSEVTELNNIYYALKNLPGHLKSEHLSKDEENAESV